MAHVVCFLSSTMEPNTLNARTIQTRNPGVLQHLTMTLMACGDIALVCKSKIKIDRLRLKRVMLDSLVSDKPVAFRCRKIGIWKCWF